MVARNDPTARNPVAKHFSKHDVRGSQFIVCQVPGNHQQVTLRLMGRHVFQCTAYLIMRPYAPQLCIRFREQVAIRDLDNA